MKNKFYCNFRRCFFYFGILIILLSFSQVFTGCGSSHDDDLTERERRRDSVLIYTKIDRSFLLYKRALTYNESFEDENARNAFESALKELVQIKFEILDKAGNYTWKRDYEELAKSIVQDYLITQKEILEGSLVFVFADKMDLDYERVQIYESKEDIQPLPQGSDVKLIRNSVVDEYIDFFSKTERGRSFIDKTLFRSGKYFPLMRKILRFHNAPEELIYLSVQESGLSPTIVSKAGAVGLWQFMPATGYAYGLYQDTYRDDRRDFEKATDAAARHLKDLYRSLGDWYLAFCAYNAGPGRVNTAIKKSGSRDFWTLRGYLPGETRNYVPSILALSFVFRNPQAYGFNNVEYSKPVAFDRISIKSSLTLSQIASLAETDIETIRELNPELTTDNVPVYNVAYQLRIPHNSYKTFAKNYRESNSIDKSYMSEPEFAGNEGVGFQDVLAGIEYKVPGYSPENLRTVGSANGKTKVTHTFKEKDVLSSIAMQYSVRPTDIRIWNNIPYGIYPKPKQQLAVYISSGNSGYGSNEEHNKNEALTNLPGNKEPVLTEKTPEKTPEKTENASDESGSRKFRRFDQTSNTGNKEYPTLSTENKAPVKTGTNAPVETSTGTTYSSENEYKKDLPYQPESKTEQTTVKTETVTPEVPKSPAPVKTETVVSKTGTTKKTGSLTHTVREGDHLSAIATEYSVRVGEIMEWNGLEDDKILIGQKLKIYTDPSLYKTSSSNKNVTISTHTVASGEHLTLIASRYGVAIDDLREWNNLDEDKILVGQKLVIKGGKNTKTSSGSKKIYIVKSGDMLAHIARDNGVSISNIMKWNGLKDDKILVGQELKLYDTSKTNVKTGNNKSKNTSQQNTPKQKQRKRKN